uniref:Alpha-1,3-glucosyltransferase n=2 Tax=Clastoptera arizonana TaxID=38151 RepID=A0A1B6BXI8_9HEMI
MFWKIVVLLSCVKLLFIPAYRSTDFEVHRNWLAITHSLPIRQWYFESTSEWTLDYPPLFAWFEFALSHLAKYVDSKMLSVKNLNYSSSETILFQRISVIVADFVFAFGIKEYCSYLSSSGVRKSSKWSSQWGSPAAILQILLLGNTGLILVDHIHFQYNGFLFGVLLLSVARIMEDHYLAAAFWFAILLNLKHIFAYIAPAYIIYFLRNYCFTSSVRNESINWKALSIRQSSKLGCIVILVFLTSYGPFIYLGQIGQVLSRLFPFKRGLCHAYWAPNFWAIYNFTDKAATLIARYSGYQISNQTASMTGGLVKESNYTVLPDISPKVTFVFTVLSIIPCLVKLWKCPGNPLHFIRCLTLCAAASFIFGWHVHEKAILMVIIPLTLLAVVWRKEAEIYLLLSTIGHYSLFPLLFTSFELPLKILLFLIHSIYAFQKLSNLFDVKESRICFPLLSKVESVYILGLGCVFFFENVIHPALGWTKTYQFLPLMLTSVYCAIGILYCWIRYYWHFLQMNEINHKRKTH